MQGLAMQGLGMTRALRTDASLAGGGPVAEFLIDGLPTTEADLSYLALVNYGAYTAFRYEGGGVRGLDLHLARLDAYAVALFGEPVGEDRLRNLIRTALAAGGDAWVRVSLFSPEIVARTPSAQVRPKVMTVVSAPPPPLATRMRLGIQTYVREEPQIKHTATMGLVRARRLARERGFDDALFADAEGSISEGSSWNIGFLRGDCVVWPDAPMLVGATQALIARGLAEVGLAQSTEPVRREDFSSFDSAFICNSATPACRVTAIDELVFPGADVTARLHLAWVSQSPEPI
ncbi:aminotransferase class IV family protein [soil metagenome]